MLTVISGCQTGADIAGLWAAKFFPNISIRGWAPKNFLTTDGTHPEIVELFSVSEHSESYRGRTIQNLQESTATLICSSRFDGGTRLTIDQCKIFKIPCYVYVLSPECLEDSLSRSKTVEDSLISFVKRKNVLGEDFILNVAGNSTKSCSRAFEFTFKACVRLFSQLYEPVVPLNVLEDHWFTFKDCYNVNKFNLFLTEHGKSSIS